jgi:hypothetical protein
LFHHCFAFSTEKNETTLHFLSLHRLLSVSPPFREVKSLILYPLNLRQTINHNTRACEAQWKVFFCENPLQVFEFLFTVFRGKDKEKRVRERRIKAFANPSPFSLENRSKKEEKKSCTWKEVQVITELLSMQEFSP